MQFTQNITLDINERNTFKTVYAKQEDNNSRFLKITMTKNGEQITPATGDSAAFRCLKPDGHSCFDSATINQDGTITVELTGQVLAVAGKIHCDVSIINNTRVLSTATFIIINEDIPLNAEQGRSSSEFLYLLSMANEAEAWAHGRTDYPERATDNAKYWSEQAQAAVGLALVDDVTGASYKLGVHDGNLYIEQILTN